MKRFLIALLIVLIIGGAIAAGYYFSSKKSPPVAEVPAGTLPAPAEGLPPASSTVTTTPPAEQLSPVGASGASVALALVSSEQFAAFSVATNGSVLGVSPDGKIFSVDQKGVAASLSSAPIDNFSGASFSSDGKKLVAAWGGADDRQFSVFDVASSTWQPLPGGTISAGWKPKSHVLVYLQDISGAKNLFVWDLDKPKIKAQFLLKLYFEDLSVGYLSSDKIFLSERSTGLAGTSFWVFDSTKKILSPVATEVRGSILKWNSAATESLSFSGNVSGSGGTLRLADASGNTVSRLQLLTLPFKCLFAPDIFVAPAPISTSTKAAVPLPPVENFLYCAIPRDQKTLSQNLLPDGYEQRAFFTADDIYRINTDDGLVSTVFADAGRSFDVASPVISGTTFFFINRYDKNLYALPIPK